MQNKIKTVFIGTPDFGIPAMESLIKDPDFQVAAVITQPDKKTGRKQVITPSPVKSVAQKYHIKVLQPEKIKDSLTEIKGIKPDLVVLAAYAQIIPPILLRIPKYGWVNIHGSLLPQYRGSSCVQAAILNGDKETGISIMKMDENLDTGEIIAREKIKINECDTAETLFNKLSILGREFLIPVLKKYINNEIEPIPQNNKKASYVKQLKKEDGLIDWHDSALQIERKIRAMHTWPGTFGKIKTDNNKSKIIKILPFAEIINVNKHKTGELFVYKERFAVQCGKNSLIINNLQIEGKNKINSEEFLKGYKNYIGLIFLNENK